MKTHEPNRLFRPWKLVEALSNSTAIYLQKLPKNVEAFDACGKITDCTFIGARAHMKKHSALERLSCLQSVFLRLSNARCFMIHSIRWSRKG